MPKFKETEKDIEIFTPLERSQFLRYARPEMVPFGYLAKHFGPLVEDTNAGLKEEAKATGKDPAKAKRVKWKKNALRHSYISYRVADTQNAALVALEAGNPAQFIFAHYRELVRPADAKTWFAIEPNANRKVTLLPVAESKAAVA